LAREEGRPPAADCNRLWALSGGRCAYPGCDQPLVERGSSKWVTQGEIAHIHACSEGGARFDRRLTVAQRDSYENTLLLCRRHHRLIDTDAPAYPADVIRAWKNTREARHVRADVDRAVAAGLLSPAPYPERHVPRAEFATSLLTRARTGPVALSGVSGSGKTTLAREALDGAAEVNYRFWLRGHDELTLLSDLAAVGAFFDLPMPAEVDADAVQPVLTVLADRPDWFVVLDDVRDVRALRLAPRGPGYVLITTQHAALPSVSTIVIEPLLELETRQILVTSPQLAAADEATVHRMAELCEGLPLAAAQIAAFSAATGTPANIHLALLEQRRGELLDRGVVVHHQTFHASIELALGGLTEDARALLDVLSALADAPVPLPDPVTPVNSVGVLQDRLRFEGAAADLRRFSLITRDVDTFRVHALVRDVVQVLSRQDRVANRLAAAALVGQQVPEWTDRADSWPIMQALEPHLILVLDDRSLDRSGVSAFIANRLGPYMCSRGRAEQGRQVLEGGLQALDPAHADKAGWRGSLLQNLANALVDIGDFDGGEQAMRESLELKKSAYGAESRLTGLAHSGLGNLLLTLGKRDEARAEHEHASAVYSRLGDVVVASHVRCK
jgi:tetratricopeptide (TPR) repeat protein